MLPIYVINLDRRPDRWQSISDNLNQFGRTAYRISAIDALSLNPQGQQVMGIGEEACFLSHCKALKHFLGSSHPAALILEDDAEVSGDIHGCLQSTDWWPENTGLLQLSISFAKLRLVGGIIGKTPCSRHIHLIYGKGGPATGYLVNRKTAQIILDACAAPTMPIDVLLFFASSSTLARRLQPVLVNPAIIQPRDIADSDTQSRHEPGWKTKRKTWGNRFFKCRVKWLKMIGRATRIHISYSDNFN